MQHAAAVRHPQQRRSLQPCRAANAEAEAQAAPAAEGAEPVKPKLMSEAWESVIQMKQEGTIVETVVKAANKSGACTGTFSCAGPCVAACCAASSCVLHLPAVALCLM